MISEEENVKSWGEKYVELAYDIYIKKYDSKNIDDWLKANKLSKLEFLAFGTIYKPTYDSLYENKGDLSDKDFEKWLLESGLKKGENNKIELTDKKKYINIRLKYSIPELDKEYPTLIEQMHDEEIDESDEKEYREKDGIK